MSRQSPLVVRVLVLIMAIVYVQVAAAQNYDLLLQGGHLVDPRNGVNGVNGVRDVAIPAGKIAAIASKIDSAGASKIVDARGLFVTPGLVDIHLSRRFVRARLFSISMV